MSERKRKELIAELREKLSTLERQENDLENEAIEYSEKRDRLHDRIRDLRKEVLSLRTQRDELNDKVKDLKQRRNDITNGIQDKFNEIRRLREEVRTLADKKPAKSHEALRKEVEKIDWTIQTTSLTSQEDKELVGQVKQLEAQLAVHRKLEQSDRKITELRTQTNLMKSEKQLLHKQLTESVQKSQETHRKMLEKIKETKKLKSEADAKHKEFLQAKEKAKPVKEEIRAVLDQTRQLKMVMWRETEDQRKQGENTLRETLESQAREKLKRGGKLTWEEFQLLADKGITEQD